MFKRARIGYSTFVTLFGGIAFLVLGMWLLIAPESFGDLAASDPRGGTARLFKWLAQKIGLRPAGVVLIVVAVIGLIAMFREMTEKRELESGARRYDER